MTKQHFSFKATLRNPWFLLILVAKVVAGSLLGSDYLVKGFIPFVNYFVTSGWQEPYTFFVEQNYVAAFPYPTLMLWLLGALRWLATPLLSADWSVVTVGHLFVFHLPILAADITIFLILCAWLKTKQTKVLWLYWASPILFYINYIHGQLDVIPMALLFIALALLFQKRLALSLLVLGLGLATKTHLLAVVPFFFMYLYVNRYVSRKQFFGYAGLVLGLFIVLIAPYLPLDSFRLSVFGTEEAAKTFLVHIPYVHTNLKLLLAPAAVLMLFLNFLPHRRFNKDAFLLILGLLFTIFVVFVPPMPGWFYWSIPFIVYFFAKYEHTPIGSFIILNLAYGLYITVAQDSVLLSSFQIIAPAIAIQPTIYQQLEVAGFNVSALVNIVFTGLVTAIVMNAVWIYRMGVRSNLQYKVTDKPLVVGIGGDSGSGKNTLAQQLVKLFGAGRTVSIEGDDAHKWERGDENWKQYTHLDPKSNRLHGELMQALGLKEGQTIKRSSYNHDTGRFTSANALQAQQNVIYVGLHPFYLSKMRQLFDIKIYLEPDEALRRHWKILRDVQQRGKTKDEVLKQIEQRAADAEKYIRPQRQFADIVFAFSAAEPLVEGKLPALQLHIMCDNSLHLDPFLAALASIVELTVEHSYGDDLQHQTLMVRGAATAAQLQTVADQLMPNLADLLQHTPDWQAGYDGLTQLFTAYYFSESQKNP